MTWSSRRRWGVNDFDPPGEDSAVAAWAHHTRGKSNAGAMKGEETGT